MYTYYSSIYCIVDYVVLMCMHIIVVHTIVYNIVYIGITDLYMLVNDYGLLTITEWIYIKGKG